MAHEVRRRRHIVRRWGERVAGDLSHEPVLHGVAPVEHDDRRTREARSWGEAAGKGRGGEVGGGESGIPHGTERRTEHPATGRATAVTAARTDSDVNSSSVRSWSSTWRSKIARWRAGSRARAGRNHVPRESALTAIGRRAWPASAARPSSRVVSSAARVAIRASRRSMPPGPVARTGLVRVTSTRPDGGFERLDPADSPPRVIPSALDAASKVPVDHGSQGPQLLQTDIHEEMLTDSSGICGGAVGVAEHTLCGMETPWSAALSGMLTGAALIIAIGAQNAYVLRLGILRTHVLPIVAICAASDALLIAAGVVAWAPSSRPRPD